MFGRRCRIPTFSYPTLAGVMLAVLSCSDATDPGFNPEPKPEVPAAQEVTVSAVSPTLVTGVVGTRAETLPTILIQDRSGNPVSGVTVFFVVTRGGGYAVASTVTSNNVGLASLGFWQLGIRPDTNVVEVRVGGKPRLAFRVTTVPGAPFLFKIAGDDQVVQPGSRVLVSPAVVVADHYQNPVAGVAVTFSSMNADDEIAGTTGTSGPDGKVQLDSWKVGALGTHIVRASAAGMTPAVFSTVAIDDGPKLCSTQTAFSTSSISATLGAGTCRTAGGRYFDTYSVNAAAGFQTIRMESASLDPYLEILAPDGTPIARNDNADATTKNSMIRVILPAGDVRITATSLSTLSAAYDIRRESPIVIEKPCDPIFVVKGTYPDGFLDSGACGAPAVHRYRIYLQANSSVEGDVVTLDYSNLYLNLVNSSGSILVEGRPVPGSYHTRFIHTVTASGYYTVEVSSSDENAGYELAIR